MSEVHLQGLVKHFAVDAKAPVVPKRGAIDGLDLKIEHGEFFVLLGSSGCGKTTTLRCIAGLEEPTSGTISIGGEIVAEPAKGRFVPPNHRNVGMVFQSYALWPHMSVYQNVAYPLKHSRRKLTRETITVEVGKALELVGLSAYEHRQPSELSGGQQQRVALARAVAAKPRLLLFDEPLSNLDAQLRARLRYDLRRIHEETGHTSIYVTHDQSEALALADRVAVMKDGRLEQLGAPTDIFLSPVTRFVAEFVGFDNVLPATVERVFGSQTSVRPTGWSTAVQARAAVPGLQVGEQVYLGFRGSSLSLGRDDTLAADNRFRGTIRSVTYLGDRYQAGIQVGDDVLQGSLSLESVHNGGLPAVGESVWAVVAPTDAVAIPLSRAVRQAGESVVENHVGVYAS